MATFSIGDALGSGFRLIGRRPLSVLVWGFAYLILGFGPLAATFALGWGDFQPLFQHPETFVPEAGRPTFLSPQFIALQSRWMMLQPLMFLGSLVARAVLTGAIFRAVLEPRNRGFAYLRLGMRELWLGLLMLAMTFLMVILVIITAIPVVAVAAGVGYALSQNNQQAWVALDIAVACALWLGTFLWICIRFSMAAPMTFADREFRLFESWTFTKGHAWKLFGLGLLVGVVLIAVMMVVEAIALASVFGSGVAWGQHHDQLIAYFQRPPAVWAQAAAPWIGVGAVILAFFVASISAIAMAPWAEAYRQLTAGGSSTPTPLVLEPSSPPPAPIAAPAPDAPAADHGHDAHDAHAADAHAPAPQGHDDHDAATHDDHGPAADPHADDAHAADDHGHAADAQAHDDHGHDDHGHDDHGDHGHDDHGHDDHGHAPAPQGDPHGHP